MPVIYRHATPEDIDAIVRLHTVAFPGFFLTSLGGSFLRLLYGAFVDIDGGICIVAQDGDCMQGVVVVQRIRLRSSPRCGGGGGFSLHWQRRPDCSETHCSSCANVRGLSSIAVNNLPLYPGQDC